MPKRDELLAQIAEHERQVAGGPPVEAPGDSPGSEETASAETPETETPEVEAEAGEETPESTPESAETPAESEAPAETPKKGKGFKASDVFAAIEASEKRTKKQNDELLGVITAMREEMATLKAGQTPPAPPPQQSEEEDPETAAWNEAFRGSTDQFITPEIQRIRQEMAVDRLTRSMEMESMRPGRDDYWDVVNLGDPENPLTKHLSAHPEIQQRISKSGNPGRALYDEGIHLRSGTPEARAAWEETERAKIRAEEEAKAQKQLQAALKRAQANAGMPRTDSIITGGSPAPAEEPLTAAALGRLPAAKKREILQKWDSGKMTIENGVLVEVV